MSWDATTDDKFTGYAEFGQKYMNFAAYSEESSAGNTFPADVGAGQFRMDVARLGGSWTHRFDGLLDDLADAGRSRRAILGRAFRPHRHGSGRRQFDGVERHRYLGRVWRPH